VHPTSRSQVALPRSPVSGTWKSTDLNRSLTALSLSRPHDPVRPFTERELYINRRQRDKTVLVQKAVVPEVETGADMCQIHMYNNAVPMVLPRAG
jgi:hypothetical protein